MQLQTERLLLRRWRDTDRDPFAQMSADPLVMEHMTRPLTRDESDAFIDRIELHFEERSYGLWAVERAQDHTFVGFIGLSVPRFEAPFMPAVEVGWRLDHPFWGQGYATEAARAAVADGFERVGLAEIVSFTTPANVRSVRVMERLGMTHDPVDDFDHPLMPVGHPARRHVLYRLLAR